MHGEGDTVASSVVEVSEGLHLAPGLNLVQPATSQSCTRERQLCSLSGQRIVEGRFGAEPKWLTDLLRAPHLHPQGLTPSAREAYGLLLRLSPDTHFNNKIVYGEMHCIASQLASENPRREKPRPVLAE